jgi:hypothetical protein
VYEDTFENLCMRILLKICASSALDGGAEDSDTFSKVSLPVDSLLKAILESTFDNLYLGRRRGGHRLGRSTGRVFDLVGNVFRDRFFDKTEKVRCRALELRLCLVSDFLRLLFCFLSVFRQLDVFDV